jgi:mannose-6-phosphate isomerase-like protein (cupin superfamily)
MPGYHVNLEQANLDNEDFRRVLFTGPKSQLVLMALPPGEDIGLEMHPHTDQFIRVEDGHGQAVVDGKNYELEDGSAIVIPAGSVHNVFNTSPTMMLKLYTIYTPPEHPDGTVHKTKAEAQVAPHHKRA